LDFSREVIGNYEGAKFLDYKDYKDWGENIIQYYNKKLRFSSYKLTNLNNWQTFFKLIDDFLKQN